jgi:hypothetical protein
LRYGEKALRELWTNQRIVVVREQCQLIEWTVRGRHPVAAGLIERKLKATFHPHGLGLNVYPLPLSGPGGGKSRIQLHCPGQQSPHPKREQPQKRCPVPEPDRLPPEGKGVINPQSEEAAPQRVHVNKIAREIFK